MACEYSIDNYTQDKRWDPVIEQLNELPGSKRDLQKALNSLESSKVIRKNPKTGKYLVNNGDFYYSNSDAHAAAVTLANENKNVLDAINAAGKQPIFTLRPTRQWRYSTRKAVGMDVSTYFVEVNEAAFRNVVPGFTISATEEREAREEYEREQIEARRSIEEQRKSIAGGSTTFNKIEDLSKKFEKAFRKAGIKITTVIDTDLIIPGRLVPISATEAEIQINPNLMGRDTLIHENAHVFIDLIGLENPQVQETLASLRGSDLEGFVSEMYPNLTGDRFDKELLSTYLGLGGVDYVSESPNAIQRLINRIVRAFSKLFGIDVKSTATLLDTFMSMEYEDYTGGILDELVQEQRATRRRKSRQEKARGGKSYRNETNKKNKIVTNGFILDTTPEKFAEELQDRIADRIREIEYKAGTIKLDSKEIENLKLFKSQLANLESVDEFADFVHSARRRTAVMKAQITRMIKKWPSLDQSPLEQEEYLAEIKRLVSVTNEVNFYYNSDFNRSTLHIIRKFVEDQLVKYEYQPNLLKRKEQRELKKVLDTMKQDLDDTIPSLEKINSDVYNTALAYYGDWLVGFHDSELDSQIKEIVNTIKENKKYRGTRMPIGLRTSDPRYYAIIDNYNKGNITKEEYDDAILELSIEHLKEKLPSRATIVKMLQTAYKDKSSYSVWVDPHIYSSWAPAQLFQLGVKESMTKGMERTRANVFQIMQQREEYKQAMGGLDINPTKFNEGLIEEVEYYVLNRSTDKYEPMKLWSYVQPFKVSEFNKAKREELEAINEKYEKPEYDLSNPEKFLDWTTSEKSDKWYKEVREWYKQNTKAKEGAEDSLKQMLKEYNDLIKKIDKLEDIVEQGVEYKYVKGVRSKIKLTDKKVADKRSDLSIAQHALKMIEQEIKQSIVIQESVSNLAARAKLGKINYKGVVYKGKFVEPSTKWLNPKYQQMQSNPALKKAYDFLIDRHRKDQKLLGVTNPMKKNMWDDDFSYLIGSIRKSGRDRLIEQGAYKTLKDSIAEGTTVQSTDVNWGTLLDVNGDPLKTTAMYYVHPVASKDVSTDVWETAAQFSHMANMHKALGDITDVANMHLNMIDNMEVGVQAGGKPLINYRAKQRGQVQATTRKGVDSNIKKAAKEFIDSVVFGQREIATRFNAFGKELELNKITSNIAKYTALNTLSFNMLQATNQFLLDNFQSFNEAAAGTYYTKEDYAWGKKVYWESGGALKDLGRFTNTTKLGQAVNMFDALFELEDRGEGTGGAKVKQIFSTDTLMKLQSVVEHELQATRMLAMMRGKKGFKTKSGQTIYVDSNRKLTTTNTGEEANLWDVLTKNDKGFLRVDPMVGNFGTKEISKFKNKLRGVSRLTNQIKGNTDKSPYQRRWWGNTVGLFRNWIPPGIRRRFGHGDGVHIDEEIGNVTEGMYTSFARLVVDLVTTHGAVNNIKELWNSRTDLEKANIKRTSMELGFGITMALVALALAKAVDDDDEDSPMTSFILYQTRRLQSEMFTYLNPGEAFRMLKSPTATARPIGNMMGLVGHVLFSEMPYAAGVPIDESDIFYQRDSGMFKKGERKLNKKLLQVFPVGPGLLKSLDPQTSVEFYDRSPFE